MLLKLEASDVKDIKAKRSPAPALAVHIQPAEFAAAVTLGFRNGSLCLQGVFRVLEELSMLVTVLLSRTPCRMNIPAFNETASRRKGAEEGLEGRMAHLLLAAAGSESPA